MPDRLMCPEFTYVFSERPDGTWDLGCEVEARPMLILDSWEDVLDFAERLMAEAPPWTIVFRKGD